MKFPKDLLPLHLLHLKWTRYIHVSVLIYNILYVDMYGYRALMALILCLDRLG